MTKTESSPEAPADPTASQEADCTYAQEESVPVEEAVTGYTQQPGFHPEMCRTASDALQEKLVISNQLQGLPVVSSRQPWQILLTSLHTSSRHSRRPQDTLLPQQLWTVKRSMHNLHLSHIHQSCS